MLTINFSIRKTFTLLYLTLALTGVTLATRANGRDSVDRTNASPAEVTYVGGEEGARVFNVVYSNPTGSRFTVKVLDAEGNLLYQNAFMDKKFDKKFRLDGTGFFGKVVFVIRNHGDGSVQSFEINTNTRMVEDVDVKEVN